MGFIGKSDRADIAEWFKKRGKGFEVTNSEVAAISREVFLPAGDVRTVIAELKEGETNG